MGVTGIVILQKALQAACKVLGTGTTATGQKATLQDPTEQLGVIEPRAVFRCKMKDMAVAGIAQKSSALQSLVERVGLKRHLAPACDQAANVQTPGGIEVVHHPVITRHAGQALVRLLKMGH